MRLSSSFSLLPFALFIHSATAASVHTLKERFAVPEGWQYHSQPHPHHIIELGITLAQPNFASLEQHLHEISDPYHSRYGQHLSKAEVDALVAPSQEAVDSVLEWLQGHGVFDADSEVVNVSFTPLRNRIRITVPLYLAESMLGTVSLDF